MRKLYVALIASLISCSNAYAFWPEALDSSFEVGAGYRNDSLSWKEEAATVFGAVPVSRVSKVHWKNLNIWEIEAKGKYVTCDDIYLRANADYGWITSGRAKHKEYVDTDVSMSNLTGSSFSSGSEFSNAENSAFEISNRKANARGHVYDVTFALGYQFRMCDDAFSISPVVGYSFNGQHLNFNHHRHSSSGSSSSSTILTGSDSSSSSDFSGYSDYYSSYSSGSDRNHTHYRTRWYGPLLGVDFDYQLCCEWDLFLTYEFHWADYHARAGRHFDSQFLRGLSHSSHRAYGNVLNFGANWEWCDCWTLGITGEFQWWYANHGKSKAVISETSVGDVSTRCFNYTPLRHVRWCTAGVTFDVGFAF